MKIKQLSVFLENKAGRLSEPCKILAEAGINILTLSLADTQQFGILRLIVKEWEGAKAALEHAGCVTNVTEVIAIEVEDRPGGLVKLLSKIEQTQINVEYIYAFTFRRKGKAIIIMRFEDPGEAINVLKSKGVNIIDSIELFSQENQK